MFASSIPVTAGRFFNRQAELERLGGLVRSLQDGTPAWLALVGTRKIGKTSLLLELSRRIDEDDFAFVVVDCLEEVRIFPNAVWRCALRLVDAALGAELGASLEALADRPAEYRAALQDSVRFSQLPPLLRADVLELAEQRGNGDVDQKLRAWLELPERLGEALGLRFLVAWDEFQELAAVPSRGGDLLAMMRSIWQRHRRTAYVISGSARAMLTELVTDERSPFFQHFALMELTPFERSEGVRLLRENAPEDAPLSADLAERAVDVLGGHPFYLQLLGEVLTRPGAAADGEDAALKAALQELLFSRTGRLGLYFENELQRLVGRSTFLVRALEALAEGPQRLSEIARAIDSASGATVRYLERLADAVVRDDDKRYRLVDPVFGLWLRWRQEKIAAIEWYRQGLVSQGRAAEIANLPRADFIDELAARKVDVVQVDLDGLDEELKLV